MGVGTILRAKAILLVVSGKDKAAALNAVVNGPITPQVPGSVLRLHPNVIIVADEDALYFVCTIFLLFAFYKNFATMATLVLSRAILASSRLSSR